MLITRIIAKNFKTYRHLDLDLKVNNDQPIILIGGENGGGKTTLFQAIYFALYGAKIKDFEHFNRLQNAGIKTNDNKIELEIHFTGKVLQTEVVYILKRLYTLNSQNSVVESVSLNFNGDTFTYGTATPPSEKAKKEAEVNKIIKANLPQELSKYFLFDAMESGNLLKEENLNRVIKENIENVMGFNKYIQLGNATQLLTQQYIADSIEKEEERKEYQQLIAQKKELEDKNLNFNIESEQLYAAIITQKEAYQNAKEGKDFQKSIQEQILSIEKQIAQIIENESAYSKQADEFLNNIELQVFLPKLAQIIQDEIELILAEKRINPSEDILDNTQIESIADKVLTYLKDNQIITNDISNDKKNQLISFVSSQLKKRENGNKFDFIDKQDVSNLEKLLTTSSYNLFNTLEQQKNKIETDIESLPQLKNQLTELRRNTVGDVEEIISNYENKQLRINDLKEIIKSNLLEITKLNDRIKRFDLSDEEVPNPKLELLKKLAPFFQSASNALLINKKAKIEESMKNDLNTTLVAYENQIDRVQLSDDLSNLSFKIFHKSGNEIYLQELNAASKQIIVQVLLKSLHHYGDYNPPVMIDTVMGYLSEDSRASLLENYFPKLSHQTILLSTDSEIRKSTDLAKIDSFISKKYTLVRDKENQCTEVNIGYFEN